MSDSRSSEWRSCLLLGLIFLAGCGKKYAHQPLALDGPEARAAQGMLAELRAASPAQRSAVQEAQLAKGTSPDQAKIILTVLESLAAATDVQLVRLDRYGDQIVQVIFQTSAARSPRQGDFRRAALLMAMTSDGYRWLGRP